MSQHLPSLIHRRGLTTWKPTVDREIVTDFATYDDYIRTIPESKRNSDKMLESHWPPSPLEITELQLTRWYVKAHAST